MVGLNQGLHLASSLQLPVHVEYSTLARLFIYILHAYVSVHYTHRERQLLTAAAWGLSMGRTGLLTGVEHFCAEKLL